MTYEQEQPIIDTAERVSAQEVGSETGPSEAAALLGCGGVAPSPDPCEPDARQARAKGPGAPRGNANAAAHGLRGSKLPPGCKHEESAVYRFRAFVREALFATHGEVDLYREALLASAVRHEMRALLAARWLRKEGDKLPLSERLALLATVSSATDARDKALKSMGLDKQAGDSDPWRSLYAIPANATSETTPEPTSGPPRAGAEAAWPKSRE